MARVWYQRAGSDSWYWAARRERLRTAGALYEDDADAFTAVCLGTLSSPLDAGLAHHSQEIWGSEYFTWMTNDHLFGRAGTADGGRSGIEDAAEGRIQTKRSLMRTWRDLVHRRVRLSTPWQATSRYHTNRFSSIWEPVHLVSVHLEDPIAPLDIHSTTFADAPEGIFPALDGEHLVADALRTLLAAHPVGSPERDVRLKALSEALLQLQLLGLLELIGAAPEPPRLTTHPLVTAVANSVLGALDEPTRVDIEVDWLGESVWITTRRGEQNRWLRLLDLERVATGKPQLRTRRTALVWPLGSGDWSDAFARKTAARLLRRETSDLWQALPTLAGVGLRFEYVPGQAPVAKPL